MLKYSSISLSRLTSGVGNTPFMLFRDYFSGQEVLSPLGLICSPPPLNLYLPLLDQNPETLVLLIRTWA